MVVSHCKTFLFSSQIRLLQEVTVYKDLGFGDFIFVDEMVTQKFYKSWAILKSH